MRREDQKKIGYKLSAIRILSNMIEEELGKENPSIEEINLRVGEMEGKVEVLSSIVDSIFHAEAPTTPSTPDHSGPNPAWGDIRV